MVQRNGFARAGCGRVRCARPGAGTLRAGAQVRGVDRAAQGNRAQAHRRRVAHRCGSAGNGTGPAVEGHPVPDAFHQAAAEPSASAAATAAEPVSRRVLRPSSAALLSWDDTGEPGEGEALASWRPRPQHKWQTRRTLRDLLGARAGTRVVALKQSGELRAAHPRTTRPPSPPPPPPPTHPTPTPRKKQEGPSTCCSCPSRPEHPQRCS